MKETAGGGVWGDVRVDIDVNLAVWRLCANASQGFRVYCRGLAAASPRYGGGSQEVPFVGCLDKDLIM